MAKEKKEVKPLKKEAKAKLPKKEVKKKTQKKEAVFKQNATEKKLVREITNLLFLLNEESLVFLKDQAKILEYNIKVASLQQKVLKETGVRTGKKGSSSLEILRGGDGSVFNVVFNNKYKMLNDSEMLDILKIVNGKDTTKEEKKANLYHWFFRERKDFLADFPLDQINDPLWDTFIALLKKNFKLKA